MMVLKTAVLFALMALSSIHAQTYVLNPYHINHLKNSPASLVLSKADEDLWLNTFYKKIPLLVALDRPQFKGEDADTLEQKIKWATQSYLELNHEQAEEASQQALQLLSEALPYPKMAKDVVEIAALQLMSAANSDTGEILSKDIPDDARPFLKNDDFLEKLPLKMRAAIRTLPLSKKIHLNSLEFSPHRLLVYGIEKSLPLELDPGRYLIHVLRQSDLEAYWLDMAEDGGHQLRKIWSRSIWRYADTRRLRETLEATKPPHLPNARISVLTKEGPLLLMSDPLMIDPISQSKISPQDNALNDPFHGDLTFTKEEPSALFKSPWFWVATTLLTGTASYFIYDAIQPKVARSP